uniref:Family with sequence similarity 183 member A n=1 Tax=Spermophilus dauricus TaxID=99837 RepID=A0A8C9PYM2_SPEDA
KVRRVGSGQFHTITRKHMSWHDNLEEPEDVRFLNLVHHAAQRSQKKYPETQMESQEIGWEAEPLLGASRTMGRLLPAPQGVSCSQHTQQEGRVWGPARPALLRPFQALRIECCV